MRRPLVLTLAVLAAATAFAPAATAFPPECDKYGDKPCYTARELACDVDGVLAPLWLEELPPRPATCP